MRTLYRLLASLKSAILVMVFLTFLSLLGTLIPQNQPSHVYLSQFPRTAYWILALGFNNMYQSLLFQIGMWLLSASTLVCILTRWKATSRKLYKRIETASAREVTSMIYSCQLKDVSQVNSEYFAKTKQTEDGSKMHLRISGKFSLLGGLFIHIGFLIILIGGLIGLHYSIETIVRGRAGDRIPIASVEGVRAAQRSDALAHEARRIRSADPNSPRLSQLREEIDRLHDKYHAHIASPAFRIVFDELSVDYHKNEDGFVQGVRSWNSKVRFLEDEEYTQPILLRVNHPASYGPYTFYQADWREDFAKVQINVELRTDEVAGWESFEFDYGDEKFEEIIELDYNTPIKPDWSPFTFVLHKFYPDFRIVDDEFITVSNELNNPAAQIIAFDDDGEVVGRAVAFLPDRVMSPDHVSSLPFLFTFHAAVAAHESGLQMVYDPGRPFVWLGCLIFTLGLIMSFYIAYKEEWLVELSDKRVFIAVSGNRPVDTMNTWLNDLRDKVVVKNQEQEN